jgi:hypothetical protein
MPMLDTAAAGAAGDDRARERGPNAFNGRAIVQIVCHDRINPHGSIDPMQALHRRSPNYKNV